MTIPTENWPKPYLLQVHQSAVEQGFIWLEPIGEADARSFTARFYRIRRRSDKSMAAFIPPEYHLVTVGRWEPGADGKGRLPVTYSQRADEVPLPVITPADPGEAIPRPQLVAEATPLPSMIAVDPAALEIKPEDIPGLVERLRQSARNRDQ